MTLEEFLKALREGEAVTGDGGAVGLHQGPQHLGMGPCCVITLKSNHSFSSPILK